MSIPPLPVIWSAEAPVVILSAPSPPSTVRAAVSAAACVRRSASLAEDNAFWSNALASIVNAVPV